MSLLQITSPNICASTLHVKVLHNLTPAAVTSPHIALPRAFALQKGQLSSVFLGMPFSFTLKLLPTCFPLYLECSSSLPLVAYIYLFHIRKLKLHSSVNLHLIKK